MKFKELRFSACIFDLDGTLLDSLGVWQNVDKTFFKVRGLAFTEDYAKAISAMKIEETADYTIKRFGLTETREEVIREWLTNAKEEFTYNVELKPFAREFLLKLKEKGTPVAVATTCMRELYVPALQRNKIYDFFDAFSDSEACGCGKDRPDIFLNAAKALGFPPRECVVFEDTAAGLASAARAGFLTVSVGVGQSAADCALDSFEEAAITYHR